MSQDCATWQQKSQHTQTPLLSKSLWVVKRGHYMVAYCDLLTSPLTLLVGSWQRSQTGVLQRNCKLGIKPPVYDHMTGNAMLSMRIGHTYHSFSAIIKFEWSLNKCLLN